MQVKIKTKEIIDKKETKKFLQKYRIYTEYWEPEVTDNLVLDPLVKYKNQIEKLQKRFGYIASDSCTLDKNTPNLDRILSPFKKEHHHTDDEVRFIVEGEGIFGINPLTDPPFEIYVAKGDLLIIPAITRHWFKLTEKKNVCCIRIFKDNPKWEAVYEMQEKITKV